LKFLWQWLKSGILSRFLPYIKNSLTNSVKYVIELVPAIGTSRLQFLLIAGSY
jgi:hypothetical protein